MEQNIDLFLEKYPDLILLKIITEYKIFEIDDYNLYLPIYNKPYLREEYDSYYCKIYNSNNHDSILPFNIKNLLIFKDIFESMLRNGKHSYVSLEKEIARINKQIEIINNTASYYLDKQFAICSDKLNRHIPKNHFSVKLKLNTHYTYMDYEELKLDIQEEKLYNEFNCIVPLLNNRELIIHQNNLIDFFKKYGAFINNIWGKHKSSKYSYCLKTICDGDALEKDTILYNISIDSVDWSTELIKELSDYFPFYGILYEYIDAPINYGNGINSNAFYGWMCLNEKLIDFEFIDLYKNDLDWGFISSYSKLNWTQEMLNKFKDYLVFHEANSQYSSNLNKFNKGFKINRYNGTISSSLYINWTIEIVNLLADYIDFEEFCLNETFIWDSQSILLFEHKINFSSLSLNKKVIWTKTLIEKYKEKWNWKNLSSNISLPWDIDLIREYENKWNWIELSGNLGLPWTYDVIKLYENKWNWKSTRSYLNYYKEKQAPCISSNSKIQWTIEMIEIWKNKLDFWALALNGQITSSIILKYYKLFNYVELTSTRYQKNSDWGPKLYHTYTNSLSNLTTNRNLKLDVNDINLLKDLIVNSKSGFQESRHVNEDITEINYSLLSILKQVNYINLNWEVIFNNKNISYLIENQQKKENNSINFFINYYLWNDFIKPQLNEFQLFNFLNKTLTEHNMMYRDLN